MATQKFQQLLDKNIFKTLGFDKMSPEKQEEAINRVGGILFQKMLMRVLPTFSEENLQKLRE